MLNTIPPVPVAVIIPTYSPNVQAWEYAREAIETASRNTPGVVLVVIDDASPSRVGMSEIAGWVFPGVPSVIQQYDRQGGLSRSWNRGLSIARAVGCKYAVCGNADCHYPTGWWGPMAEALASGATFVGPVTNAPGHRPAQWVEAYLVAYRLSCEAFDIERTAADMASMSIRPVPAPRGLNGFTFAGSVQSFFDCAHRGNQVFSESIPMAGNEDDFFARALRRGRTAAIVPRSFVFHYRSVSRGLGNKRLDAGFVRHGGGCSPCEQNRPTDSK